MNNTVIDLVSVTPEAASAAPVLQIVKIRVVDIVPDERNQGRNDEESLRRLAASIERDGLLSPIIVRLNENPLDVKYVLIAGERRWRAHRLLGREEIEARIVTDESQLAIVRKRAVENLHRENLNPIQEAKQYAELIESGMSQTEAAREAGVDQSTMSNRLRVLRLPPRVQAMIEQGRLTRAHGIALLRFEKWPELLELIAALAAYQGVGSKALEKGLPFAQHDEVKDHVVEVWGATLPEEWRNDPDVMVDAGADDVSCGYVYVLDVKRWKAGEAARMVSEAKARDAARASNAPDKVAAAKAADERKAVLKRNEERRAKIKVEVARAAQALRSGKVPAGLVAAQVVRAAIAGGYLAARLAESFAAVGVTPLPGVLPGNGSHGLRNVSAMRKMRPDDLLRAVAHVLLAKAGDEAIRDARDVPDDLAQVASYAGKAPQGGPDAAIPRGKGKGQVVVDPRIEAEVKKQTEAGRTLSEIAKATGLSVPAVHRIRSRLGLVKAGKGAK